MKFQPASFSRYSRIQSLSSGNQIISVAPVSVDVFKLSAVIACFSIITACTSSNSSDKTASTGTEVPHTQAPDKQSADKQPTGPTRTLKTVMTSEGVECPAVRGDDGTLYTIPSIPHNFEAGDRLNIIIENPIVPMASFCQQGETIDWIRIEQVSASGEILKYWEK